MSTIDTRVTALENGGSDSEFIITDYTNDDLETFLNDVRNGDWHIGDRMEVYNYQYSYSNISSLSCSMMAISKDSSGMITFRGYGYASKNTGVMIPVSASCSLKSGVMFSITFNDSAGTQICFIQSNAPSTYENTIFRTIKYPAGTLIPENGGGGGS